MKEMFIVTGKWAFVCGLHMMCGQSGLKWLGLLLLLMGRLVGTMIGGCTCCKCSGSLLKEVEHL